jgi:hypothetical protein
VWVPAALRGSDGQMINEVDQTRQNGAEPVTPPCITVTSTREQPLRRFRLVCDMHIIWQPPLKEVFMPVLLWYFPFIITSGICELLFSTREERHGRLEQADKNSPRAPN